ncbi:MAG: elongation factor G, partial [Candidatus Rokuibacteriota bacterium]
VVLESIEFPEPVIHIAIEPKTKTDQERLGESLAKLALEDPSFRVSTDPETAQTLIGGQGELHLEIIVDRLVREFQVAANVGKPQVAYKETITRGSRPVGRYIRQTGGSGHYGHVVLEVEPAPAGTGVDYQNKVAGGSVPREYWRAIESGAREALQSGLLAGYPVLDVRVRLVDGSYHDVDSNEMAFKIAASLAIKQALEQGGEILLEPIRAVEVVAPESFTGPVIDDLNSRRGRITDIQSRGTTQVIQSQVPLATMFGYVNSLRSLTQGRATFTLQFHHYAQVPESVAAVRRYGGPLPPVPAVPPPTSSRPGSNR